VEALRRLGEANEDAVLPGYTHLQRAQPVLLSHHLDAHAWALLRDVDRLLDARRRLNVSPWERARWRARRLASIRVSAGLLGFARPSPIQWTRERPGLRRRGTF